METKHLWATLRQAHAGRSAGEQVKLASADEKQRLLDAGTAAECPDPEEALVAKAVGQIVDAAMAAVDQRIDALSKAAGAAPHYAAARDHERDKLAGFRTAGEFWKAVADAGTPGRSMDARLLRKDPSGLNTLSGPDGGFLAPPAIGQSIMDMVYAPGRLLPMTDTEVINANSIILKAVNETSRANGFRRGGVLGAWMNEADTYASSKPTFRQLTLKPHKLGVFYYATDEELSDSAGFALEQKLVQYAAEEIDWLVSDAIVNGTGPSKPTGFLASPALVSVPKEAGQAAGTIVFQNLVKMYSRMLPRSLGNAVWLVNQEALPQLLAMAFPGATGTAPAFMNGNFYPTIAKAPFGTLFGRPVIVTEHNPAVGQVGDVAFVDLGMYKTVTRGAVRQALSVHLRFDYGETAFRFDFRIDGQTWQNAPVAPAFGTAPMSAFVALAART